MTALAFTDFRPPSRQLCADDAKVLTGVDTAAGTADTEPDVANLPGVCLATATICHSDISCCWRYT